MMKKPQKVKVTTMQLGNGNYDAAFKLGNWTAYSEPYSGKAACKRGVRAFFKQHLFGKTPVFEK